MAMYNLFLLSLVKSRLVLKLLNLLWLLEGGSETLLFPSDRWLGLWFFSDRPLEVTGAS